MATIVISHGSSPFEDAQLIKNACLGLGTDEKSIIQVLAHRNRDQIKLIKQAYQDLYQEDLIHQLHSELSGNFLKAICLWVTDPVEREATLAHNTLRKRDPDYKLILEIICTKSPEELLTVKRAYQSIYKRAFEEDVASYTNGKIRKFLVGMVSTYKYHGEEIDEEIAFSDANTLHDEIQGGESVHDEIIRIISTRSKRHLLATFNHFKGIHGTSITKALRGDADDEFLRIVRAGIRCIKNPKKHFAKILRSAIKGFGTDNDGLSRVIVTRAEIDLKEIKDLYVDRNNVSLEQAVAEDTAGDYKTFLLTLLGSEGY